MKQLQKLFEQLGHNKKEATLLDVLFRNNALRAIDLSKKTGIQRTTVYSVLKELQKTGLIYTTEEYGVTYFASIPPDRLPEYIARKREQLHEYQSQAEQMLPQLLDARSGMSALPNVSFFQGKEGVKQAYEETLNANQEKKIYVFSGPDAVFEQMGQEYVAYYTSKRKKLGIESFQIAPNTPYGQLIQQSDTNYIRRTLLIPAEFSFDTEMVIFDNKIGMFSFSNDTLIAVIIEDLPIVNTMKVLFRYMSSTINP